MFSPLTCANSPSSVQPVSSTDDLASGLQLILDRLPKVPLLDAAPEVLLLDAAPFDASEVFSYASNNGLIDVPELDWAVPETPTIRAPEAPKAQPPTQPPFDIYIYHYPRVPDAGTNEPPAVVPGDDAPPVWNHVPTRALLHRMLLKKGRFPTHVGAGTAREFVLLLLRGCCVIHWVARILQEFAPYYGTLRAAWHVYQERRRRRRRHTAR